jgi:myo-inositol catabolism protein IolC
MESTNLTCIRFMERRDRKRGWSSILKHSFWAATGGLWAHGIMVSSGLWSDAASKWVVISVSRPIYRRGLVAKVRSRTLPLVYVG